MTTDTGRQVFGRVDPDELDIPEAKPNIEFTLVGYDKASRDEHTFDFAAYGDAPEGSTLRLYAVTDENGSVRHDVAVKFIHDSLIEEDRERWFVTLNRRDLHFEASALTGMAKMLMETYAEIPSQPRSARRAGSRRTTPTSGQQHSGRVTAGKH